MERLGEVAAFGTAICWTASALFFERASKRVGALAVNFYKVLAAFLLLCLAGLVLRGMALPLDASPRAWLFLALSGVIGFVITDYFLFTAYILIGARITVVFQAATPLFAAALGFLVLGERMRPSALLGMALVVPGILAVVWSRNRAQAAARAAEPGRPGAAAAHAKGLLFAFLAAVFQAVGLIFSKLGLGDYDAIPGTQIRVLTAVAGFALQALVLGRARELFVEAPRDRAAMKATAIGAVFGPFLGVTLSLFALQRSSAGTASTLMGLTPILIIPPAILLLKQKVQALEVLGALVAVAGAALFFLL